MSKPINQRTQKDFNADHAEAAFYGDEGDYIVVGTQYTETEALDKIKELLMQTQGDLEGYDLENLGRYGMVVGKNEDGEDDYCVSFGKLAQWQAWGVAQS